MGTTLFGTSWQEKTSAAPFPASNNIRTIGTDDFLYTFAGKDINGGGDNSVWKSADGENWTMVHDGSSFPTAGVAGLHFQALGSDLYVFGGKTSGGTGGSTFKSTDGGVTWAQTETHNSGTVWGYRGKQMASTVFDDKLWIMGGDDQFTNYKKDVWHSSDGITWTSATTNAAWGNNGVWDGRGNMAVTGVGSSLYLIAGTPLDSMSNQLVSSKDVWTSSDDGVTWTQVTDDAGFGDRMSMASATTNSNLYIYGGAFLDDPDPSFDDLWQSTDGGLTWTQLFDNGDATGTGRAAYSLPIFDSSLWVTGNEDDTGGKLNDVWRITFVSLTENPLSDFSCTPYGNAINRLTSVSPDFNRVLIMDMNHKAMYAGWGWGISCSLSHSSPCAGTGVLPEAIIGGGIDGYISKCFTDDAFGLGTPSNRVYWPISGANATVLTINPNALSGDFFQTNSMKQMTIYVHKTDGTTTARVVTSNTNVTVTIPTIANPELIDYILIAPMTCGLVFGEKRTTLPSSFLSVLMDVLDTQSTPQTFTFDIFAGSGARDTLDTTDGPAVSLTQDSDDLTQGQGDVQLPQHASKSLALGINFQPYGDGVLQLGPVSVQQFLCPGERVRSEEK